ncbi:MAG: hypothetical protein P1U69_13650 [Parvibaculaceae bacterium]|nr:hypothetical protein [Parvibaculaceae bacterium]HBM86935.1 hypothetical protein [Rhodobiaceae bacterium]|tara:strand:+ start:1402 stop:1815 length:414 start_codon:yes stop_codon:yes gene_type:complete
MLPYLNVVLPIATLIAGAVMQHWLSKSNQKSQEATLRQQQAYVDYLAASVGAKYQSNSPKKDSLAALIDAKLRVSVYGSKGVIEKLASFEKGGARLDNDTSIANYLKLVVEMRKTTNVDPSGGSTLDLETILFGSKE